MAHLRPAAVGRKGDVWQILFGVRCQIIHQPPRSFVQRTIAFGGQRQQVQRTIQRWRHRFHDGGGFQHNMRVGAAKAKGTDTCNQTATHTLPGHPLCGHADRQLFPGDQRAGVMEMQMRRNFLMLHHQHHFNQAGDACRRFGMADVSFDGPNPHRLICGAPLAEGGPQRLHFDRVAQRSPGAVRLHIADLFRLYAGISQSSTNHCLLRGAVGRGQAAAGAVLVDRRTPDHGQDTISGSGGIRQAFEDHHAAAFAAHETIRRRIKGLAVAIRGQHAIFREGNVIIRRQDQVNPTRQRHITLAAAQALRRQMYRHQRRRAGCINRDAWPLQAQRVRQPPGYNAVRDARSIISVEQGGIVGFHVQVIVVAGRHPDKHPGRAAI